MLATRLLRPVGRVSSPFTLVGTCRPLSTLPNNSHIYIFPSPTHPTTSLLTLLPTDPPTPDLALGTTTAIPPTPSSFTENPHFLRLLQAVIKQHATSDPDVQSQAAAYASQAGASLGTGGSSFVLPANHPARRREKIRRTASASAPGGGTGGDGAGGASAQGGAGSGGRGGWVHVSDQRAPPDYGRIAFPEDIFGSLEVDGRGKFVDEGNYQESGTYRICTREGILGLSPYLRERLVERLTELEKQLREQRK